NKNCVICFDNYEPTTKIKVLPCTHGFHPDCITKWDHQGQSTDRVGLFERRTRSNRIGSCRRGGDE
ncbi:hypothetical protein EBZ35_08655, partial [bacterium]|nr:hypothetical protein [bacterium]